MVSIVIQIIAGTIGSLLATDIIYCITSIINRHKNNRPKVDK